MFPILVDDICSKHHSAGLRHLVYGKKREDDNCVNTLRRLILSAGSSLNEKHKVTVPFIYCRENILLRFDNIMRNPVNFPL